MVKIGVVIILFQAALKSTFPAGIYLLKVNNETLEQDVKYIKS